MSLPRDSKLGWLAPLAAVAGLALAMVAALGWGVPVPRATWATRGGDGGLESYTSGHLAQDAGPPDARPASEALVGSL